MDYAKVPTNWRASELEERDEEEASAPVVDVVINDYRKNKESHLFAVQVSVTFPRMKEE